VKLTLDIDPDHIVLGTRVAGRVTVVEGGPSRSLTVTVSFHEKTRDFDVVSDSEDFVVHEGDLVTGQTYDFSFNMPVEAPPSVRCEHSELYWELNLKSDEPGVDTHASRRLEVVAEVTSNE